MTMTRVVKVGGSLFSFDEMPDRARTWLDQEPPGVTIIIGGGGDIVEPLRVAQERFGLDQEGSHWMAVRAMTVTSRLLASLLDVELVERFETIESLVHEGKPLACVLDVEEFLRIHEMDCSGCKLPHNWTCTSDSIAARVAEVLAADELVLLKSTPLPPGMSFAEAASRCLVDAHFPQAAIGQRRIRWVDLRA